MKTNQMQLCKGSFEALAYNDHFCSVPLPQGHQQNLEHQEPCYPPRDGVKMPMSRRFIGLLAEKMLGHGRVFDGAEHVTVL